MNAAAWNVSVLLATLFILTATDAESPGARSVSDFEELASRSSIGEQSVLSTILQLGHDS